MASSSPIHEAKTVIQLRALLAARSICHGGLRLKAQLVAAAYGSDAAVHGSKIRKRKADEELEKENAKKLKLEHELLVAEIEIRGLQASGTTIEELRDTVRQDDKRIRKEEKKQKQKKQSKSIQERKDIIWATLFLREFQVDPKRSSFLDLPRELRDVIYGHLFDLPRELRDVIYGHLFDHPDVTNMAMKIRYHAHWDRFNVWNVPARGISVIIKALNALGTLNKTIRKEVRAIFWSLAVFNLEPHVNGDIEQYVSCAPYYMAIFERFVPGLGDDERFGI
ncbi:hypothetical protein CC86DRAFT_385400 [Ophiobolus disseminans]|uniref:Uncharacterized protein n=1 Tax=Ophiobolus disseminans TaxID=1469910 RepID=A0A6A6ZNK8_9PLEO|nr:hypothetical protein CC86DRAFT_385400 [Ophiobolus disseminans]